MTLSLEQYAGAWINHPDFTTERRANATALVTRSNALIAAMTGDGVRFTTNPKTGSLVSGTQYGGFRPMDCPQGAAKSKHKTGNGVDIYDPTGKIDEWIYSHVALLTAFGLWFESPSHTPSWSHWQDIPPGSGTRFFVP